MKIFKDKFSGDEMFTDIYDIELVDQVVYKVKGKQVTESTDTSNINIGANASEEAPDEQCDDSAVSGVNIVLSNRLVETAFGKKKDYQLYIKDYMKKVIDELDGDEKGVFKANIQPFIKKVCDEFKEYQFFTGENMNAEAMCALMRWEEETPYMYFFKHGLEEEKV